MMATGRGGHYSRRALRIGRDSARNAVCFAARPGTLPAHVPWESQRMIWIATAWRGRELLQPEMMR